MCKVGGGMGELAAEQDESASVQQRPPVPAPPVQLKDSGRAAGSQTRPVAPRQQATG